MTGGIMVLILGLLFAAGIINEEAPELFNEIIEALKGAKQ